MSKKRGPYKKINLETWEGLEEAYDIYVEQFNRTLNYLKKRNNISRAGLRLTKESSWADEVGTPTLEDFISAAGDFKAAKGYHESLTQVLQRGAKERALNIDTGLMTSVEKAYKEGKLFGDTGLTLAQVKDKIRFDTDFRNDYFDKINGLYQDLRMSGYSAKGAQRKIAKTYFGSN